MSKRAVSKTAAKRTGRPSLYRPEFAQLAAKFCLLGATDAQLADAFGVSEVTINAWKKQYPDFLKSLKAGKGEADANVAASLYRRAMGYEHKAVKIFADPKTGAQKIVEYIERYAPDTTACIFWLKNRQSGEWRDKQAMELSGQVAGSGVLAVPVPPDANQWAATAAAQQALLSTRPTIAAPTESDQ